MSNRFRRIIGVLFMCAMMLMSSFSAAQALTAGVVMTVSRTTQDSIINEGENLTIDVQIDGVEPALYKWFYEDEPIAGASDSIYTIFSAKPGDAGLYRVEAYAEDGKMLVTMEFSVRVIDKVLPKSGDNTLSAGIAIPAMSTSAAALAILVIRRKFTA